MVTMPKKREKAPPDLIFPDEQSEKPAEDALIDPAVQKILKEKSKNVNKVIVCLENIMKGSSEEQVYDSKLKELVSRPIAASVKVQAAKVWNDLVMKKVVADKKEVAAKGGGGYDVARAIAAVNRSKDQERKRILLAQGKGNN